MSFPRPRRPSRGVRLVPLLALAGAVWLASQTAARQLPLSPRFDAGQTVTPAFEGWYPNADGTFTLSFGYFNRNQEQVVEIPIGEDNRFEQGAQDLGQPTRFEPQRHWGVFTVKVPADFGTQKLVWTLRNGKRTFSVPGHLRPEWLLDAKRDPASGNTPPVLRFDPEGPEGTGPDGVVFGPLDAEVGAPLKITLWATDDEIKRGGPSRQTEPILLAWFEHRGPKNGAVTFSEREPKVDKESGGRSETEATFSEPGDYILRVRANDYSGLSSGGHSQCCWTNGFVLVTVK